MILLSMKRSPPHTLEGEELVLQKKIEDKTKESSLLTSSASVDDSEDVMKVDLPNDSLHSDEAESKILIFNRPLQSSM